MRLYRLVKQLSNLQNDIIREDEFEQETMKCKCGKKLTWGIYNYSMGVFREPLCVDCQKVKRIEQNPKIGKMINDQIDKEYADKNK